MFFHKLLHSLKQIKLSQVSLKLETCELCGWKVQIKTSDDEMGVRCTRCLATPVSQMMGYVFKLHSSLEIKQVYELSSRGAFVRFLKNQNFNLTLSEYFDDVPCGSFQGNIQCQNVERLTYEDNCFDICTSLEVFEHVENDIKGFLEIYRVLKNKGTYIFTVPIDLNSKTIERTEIVKGKRKNILPPEFHSDSIRGNSKVFCYRNYGKDILDRLKIAGFSQCEIYEPPKSKLFGFGRPVIIAKKL